MSKLYTFLTLIFFCTISLPALAQDQADDLDQYVERLKRSKANFGSETAFMSVGSDFLYAQEYFEAKNYSSAASGFMSIVQRDKGHAFANYQLAIALLRQNDPAKAKQAQEYLDHAFSLNPKLKYRFPADMPKPTPVKEQQQAKASGSDVVKQPTKTPPVQKPQEAKPKPQQATASTAGTAPAKESKYGGTLLMGDYTCHQTVYNGARATPAFSFQYKGYFQLKNDGTYRWLDNGGTGRYSYDPKTGNIKWLSGHLANTKPQSSIYQLNTNSAQITINFTSDYRWECGCDKK